MKSTRHLATAFIFVFIGIFNSIYAQAPGDPVYYKGEIYPTIVIGSQCWMTQNLDVGTFTPGTTPMSDNDILEKYCYGDNQANCNTYGGLYNWDEMMDYQTSQGSQGICPIGWHIPTMTDWNTLVNQYPFLSSSDSLIITGTSGFDALLGGYSNGNGGFFQLGIIGVYYSSYSDASKFRREFYGSSPGQSQRVKRTQCSGDDAYSIRCMRNSFSGTIPFAVSLNAFDALCNGGSDGHVIMTLSGVSNPTFLWSNGATTEDLLGVTAGTYSVTVTEGTNTITSSATVGEPTEVLPVLSISQQISCYNGENGKISVSTTGGTPPYLCIWSNGSTTANLQNIAAGTYSITVFDSNNCEATSSITISNPNLVVDFSSNVTMPTCNGNNNGAIDLIPNNAGTYYYYWNTFQSAQDILNLSEGSFSVTIYNLPNYGGSCTYKEFEITDPDPIYYTQIITNASVQNSSDASINITVSGGTSPYSYLWSNGATSEDISNIPAGSYHVTITDAHSCYLVSNQILVTEPGININYVNPTAVSCNGNSDGQIYVSATSASCSNCLNYSIVPGQTQLFGGFYYLAAGTYNMTITDNAGGVALVENIIIAEPNVLEIASFTEVAGCTGSNITINATGGTPPFTYSKNGTNYQSSNVFTNVAAGLTTFYVKDSKSCQSWDDYMVSPVSAMAISGSVSDASCYGSNNGSILLTVNNGTPPYTYYWLSGSTVNYRTGLIAGNYTVTVSDANACTAIQSFTLTEPNMIQLSLTKTNVTYPNGTNGSVTLSASGGFPPLSFAWSNGSSQQNLTGVPANFYVVTVSDSHQCTATASIQVSQNYQPVTMTFSKTNVSCYGLNNGTVSANVSGGNTPYSFLWSNGATSQSISNLAAGFYSLTVTGYYGMTGTGSVSIIQPNLLQVSVNATSIYNGFGVSCFGCADGQVSAAISGGTPPYGYVWSNSFTDTQISGLVAGSYSVTVVDGKNCLANGSTTLQAPTQISVSLQSTNVSCFGGNNGSVTANASGGVGSYTYLWNTGATTSSISNLPSGQYSVSVSDANSAPVVSSSKTITQPGQLNINALIGDISYPGGNNGSIALTVSGGTGPYTYYWSTGASTQAISGLPVGTYYVTATDQNNCQQTGSYSLVVNYSPTQVVFTVNNVSCYGQNNGSIVPNVSGSQVSSYAWSNGATTSSITNLAPGIYYLTTTNVFGLTNVWTDTVTQPTEIVGAISINSNYNTYKVSCANCTDGEVTAYASGGYGPYSFLWSTGGTNATLSNIGVGTYTVTITGQTGCTDVVPVTLTAPSAVQVYIIPTPIYSNYHVSCNGSSSGSATAYTSGGVPPYSYNWSTGATNVTASGLSAQIYTLTVTDQNGATSTAATSLNAPPSLNLTLNTSHNTCFGESAGVISASVNGGISPYTYLWSNGSTNNLATSLSAGYYTVTVTDYLGCSSIGGQNVNQPSQITMQANPSPASCFGSSSGSINLTVNGGTPPYNFSWTNGANTEDIANLASGNYSVLVTDINTCSASMNNYVGEPAEITTQMTVSEVSIPGFSDGSIDMVVSGGTAPYTFLWSNGATTQNITNLSQAIYAVTITDSHNCISIDSGNVNIPEGLFLFDSITDVMCSGGSNGQISISVLGGTPPYSFVWSNGATTSQISGLAAGTYSVTVHDIQYNIVDSTYTVGQPDALDVDLISTPVSCYGGGNGSIEVVVTGGTPPYIYAGSAGITSSFNDNLSAKIYAVYIVDSNNCMSLSGTSVDQPSEINVQTTISHATNIGLTNGSASLSVSGGTPPYSYFWSNNFTGSSCSNLGAGTYIVMVTDAANCNLYLNFEILDDPTLIVFGCRDPLALNFNPLANADNNTCIYIDNPPDWTFSYTGISHSILMPGSSNILINNTPIEPGDYIGVFYNSGGTLACGGYVKWLNNGQQAISAWGDDAYTSIIDGFQPGEAFFWKIWDASADTSYNTIPTYDYSFAQQDLFVGNGMSGIVSLSAITSETQEIDLVPGFNTISTYIDPFDPNFGSVLSDIVSYVVIVKDGHGQVYWPQHGVNTIGDMTIGEGYKIKMNSYQTLIIEGLAVSPEMIEIPIPQTWSILGYLRKTPASIVVLLSPIVNNIIIVKDVNGLAYWPQFGLNAIGDMKAGSGYDISMYAKDTLVYPANFAPVPTAGPSSKSLTISSKASQIKITDNNMTLGIPLSAWESLPAYGVEINVYSETGEIVGSTAFNGENVCVTIWGNDELTPEHDGLTKNDNFVIKLETPNGNCAPVVVEYWIEGNETYDENGISIVGKLAPQPVVSENQIEVKNMPNPFTSFTKINFSLTKAEIVKVVVYNELGAEIMELANHEFGKGNHKLRFDATGLPSGTYFYKLTAGDFTQTHQMNLIK